MREKKENIALTGVPTHASLFLTSRVYQWGSWSMNLTSPITKVPYCIVYVNETFIILNRHSVDGL